MSKFKNVDIYTDGACRGNPGAGGWGIILQIPETQYEKEFSAGYRKTTNNRMELLAVIEALKKLRAENLTIRIFSDSQYVINSVERGWVFSWEKKDFKDKKNPDLWREFLSLYRKHKISFIWVKGHNNHPKNERCDLLATSAADSPELLIDEYYEEFVLNQE